MPTVYAVQCYPADSAEVKPSIPGQKQVKYGANAETIFAAVLLFKPASQPASQPRTRSACICHVMRSWNIELTQCRATVTPSSAEM